jgi:hypothetical protein
MKAMTTSMPTTEAITPWRIESAPSEGPDGALLQIADRGGQRAGAEQHRQVLGLLLAHRLPPEMVPVSRIWSRMVATSLILLSSTTASDFALVRTGEVCETVASGGGQVEDDLRLIGIGVAPGLRVANIGAADFGDLLDLVDLSGLLARRFRRARGAAPSRTAPFRPRPAGPRPRRARGHLGPRESPAAPSIG